jgi:hypothetical protein
MTDQLIHDGQLHSPFFIFVRQPHGLSDVQILALFALDAYERTSQPTRHGRHAIMSDGLGWTMLADDWYYTLWHLKTTRPAINELAKRNELYACTEGDCDRSFDFAHYKNGQLTREYVVRSPHFSDRQVVKNWGAPLPGEAGLLEKDGHNIGIELAAKLGIKIRFTMDELRIYVPSRDIGRTKC